MSNTTTTTVAKDPAKKAPAKATTKKPAAEKAESETGELYVYEATGRAGITNRRTFPAKMAVAADVKDESHTSARWKQGVITRFFATKEMAEKYAERQRETGCDVQIVDAKLVATKECK
jgi:hypothetical protein